jgi:hypothetical protein
MKTMLNLPCWLLLFTLTTFSQTRYPIKQGDNLLRLQLINYSDQELADLSVQFATDRPSWLSPRNDALRNLARYQPGEGLPRSVLFVDLPFQVTSSGFNDSQVTLELVLGGQVVGAFKVQMGSSNLGGSTSFAMRKSGTSAGELESSTAENPRLIVPTEFALTQNYPNPFNPTTSIQIQLPENGWTLLQVYDVLGREVKTLVNREMAAGSHVVTWDGTADDGRAVPSGVYIYRLTTQNFVSTKKMIVVR